MARTRGGPLDAPVASTVHQTHIIQGLQPTGIYKYLCSYKTHTVVIY
jgi:hypothetical protein